MITIGSVFHVSSGHQLALNHLDPVDDEDSGDEAVAYVSRSHRNNGVSAWVRRVPGVEPIEEGAITVALRSRNHSLSAFVQPRPFYTTYHVAILTPKKPMSLSEKLWWCLCIRANRFRFGFGRQANRTIRTLRLPAKAPAWVKSAKIPSHAEEPDCPRSDDRIDTSRWKSFPIPELFRICIGELGPRRDMKAGNLPMVTASMRNNGITAMVDLKPDWGGGQITVANNGIGVGTAFYQARAFSASHDVTVLDPKIPLTRATALFICAMIRKESIRFNYARKWTTGRMKTSTVRLPSKGGKADLKAMKQIMGGVRLGWLLEGDGAA